MAASISSLEVVVTSTKFWAMSPSTSVESLTGSPPDVTLLADGYVRLPLMTMFEFGGDGLHVELVSLDVAHVTTSRAPVICPLMVTLPLTKMSPVSRLLRVMGLLQ